MEFNLFDDVHVKRLYPLTLTRPAAALRCGILTVAEKWETVLDGSAGFACRPALSPLFPEKSAASLHINGRLLPTIEVVTAIRELKPDQSLWQNDILLATRCAQLPHAQAAQDAKLDAAQLLLQCWDLFAINGAELQADFERLSLKDNRSQHQQHNQIYGDHPVHIADGATVRGAMINASDAPVYVGPNAEIMEGVLIRGGLALCAHAVLKMGAKIYGPTTIGPWSKVGGEVNNSVIIGYSNKGHDGFLGNSVLGEWCNLGADTNNSNLKNNYGLVSMFDYAEGREISTGRQFAGLIMGDHSKCGINTMFNTGTVIGISSNIFGADFPPKFIPSFVWGGVGQSKEYRLGVALRVAEKVMQRRGIALDANQQQMLTAAFEETADHRNEFI